MAFPLSLYVSLTLFQVFRIVSTPVPDRVLDPNVQTCAQVMTLQLHRKVQKMNMTQRKLAKMLYDCSLFWEGVWMSDMGSQARGPCVFDSDLRQFHHLPPQSTWMICVCARDSPDSNYKHSTTFIHVASIPLERVFFGLLTIKSRQN